MKSEDHSPWSRSRRYSRFLGASAPYLADFISLLAIRTPDAAQLMRRIQLMERNIILPLKAAGIAMLLQTFYSSPWIGIVSSTLDVAVESVQYFLWFYILANVAAAAVLMAMHRVPLGLVMWAVFVISLVDGIFLGALTLVTGGYDSILYWLFVGLIVRVAVSVPRATSQLMLNFTLSACYLMAGWVDHQVSELLDETSRRALDLSDPVQNPAENLLLRLSLLLLMTGACYSVQALLERQRQALEEAREFAAREGQLRSAGRLAAEFAHQIKNPLAIINNALYSMQRALNQGRTDVHEQVEIIQEEIGRSDRIITQLMGYAQLSEGRVEKLDVLEELEYSIERVFPPAAGYAVRIERDLAPDLPPLLMLRRHLRETFMNLLQNAREALGEQGGTVRIRASCEADYAVEVAIADTGPGIAPDKQERIFEAYYTTKEKGTGIGLATVKHDVELYGGKVRLESELGKGACFIVNFPAKTLVKSSP